MQSYDEKIYFILKVIEKIKIFIKRKKCQRKILQNKIRFCVKYVMKNNNVQTPKTPFAESKYYHIQCYMKLIYISALRIT